MASTPLLAAFELKKEEAERFSALWRPLDEQIYRELRAVYESRPDDPVFESRLLALDAERQDMSQTLEKAFARLLDSLYHPELVLAAAGTTSSGKSALVNLLCGAEVMPVAFDEMSAGVVSIRHGPGRTLNVQETPGAAWECGSWTGLSDDEICERLRRVMRAYHSRRDEAAERPDSVVPPCSRRRGGRARRARTNCSRSGSRPSGQQRSNATCPHFHSAERLSGMRTCNGHSFSTAWCSDRTARRIW